MSMSLKYEPSSEPLHICKFADHDPPKKAAEEAAKVCD